MLQDSYTNAQGDVGARMLREQRIDALRLMDATQAALEQDGAQLLAPPERAVIEHAIAALNAVLNGSDHGVIKRAADKLNRATADFAAQRMNASIQRALTGQRLDAIGV